MEESKGALEATPEPRPRHFLPICESGTPSDRASPDVFLSGRGIPRLGGFDDDDDGDDSDISGSCSGKLDSGTATDELSASNTAPGGLGDSVEEEEEDVRTPTASAVTNSSGSGSGGDSADDSSDDDNISAVVDASQGNSDGVVDGSAGAHLSRGDVSQGGVSQGDANQGDSNGPVTMAEIPGAAAAFPPIIWGNLDESFVSVDAGNADDVFGSSAEARADGGGGAGTAVAVPGGEKSKGPAPAT